MTVQGGRDKLGWIRQLVRYTETHPIYIADNASSAVEVLQDGSIQKTVFPSLKPNRREDTLLLQQWLADMMAQLTANAPQTSSGQVRSAHLLCILHCDLCFALLPQLHIAGLYVTWQPCWHTCQAVDLQDSHSNLPHAVLLQYSSHIIRSLCALKRKQVAYVSRH